MFLDEWGNQIWVYHPRVGKLIKTIKLRHNIDPWDAYVHKANWNFAGRVARMQSDRLAFRVLKHLDRQATHLQSLWHGGNQGHGRRLRTCRFEASFYGFFTGAEFNLWQQVALDKRKWDAFDSILLQGQILKKSKIS